VAWAVVVVCGRCWSGDMCCGVGLVVDAGEYMLEAFVDAGCNVLQSGNGLDEGFVCLGGQAGEIWVSGLQCQGSYLQW